MKQSDQAFYLTRLPDKFVLKLVLHELQKFSVQYLRHAYGVGTHEWLISTKKP